jgi:hypothetical protein
MCLAPALLEVLAEYDLHAFIIGINLRWLEVWRGSWARARKMAQELTRVAGPWRGRCACNSTRLLCLQS